MSSRIIGKLDLSRYDFCSEIACLNGIEKGAEEYDEFADGFWKNISLVNSSGSDGDSQYRNSDCAVSTGHMSRCPQIARMISDNFDESSIRMVRARNLVDGVVIPHRDFVELDQSVGYLRVFIPLEKNPDSFHSDEDGVFQMMPGEVWFLDASINHAAVNFSSDSRMFLCIDFACDRNFNVEDVMSGAGWFSGHVARRNVDRVKMGSTQFEDMLASIAVRLAAGKVRECVIECARIHFKYDVPIEACYGWLLRAGKIVGDELLLDKLERLRVFLMESRGMNERFVL